MKDASRPWPLIETNEIDFKRLETMMRLCELTTVSFFGGFSKSNIAINYEKSSAN